MCTSIFQFGCCLNPNGMVYFSAPLTIHEGPPKGRIQVEGWFTFTGSGGFVVDTSEQRSIWQLAMTIVPLLTIPEIHLHVVNVLSLIYVTYVLRCFFFFSEGKGAYSPWYSQYYLSIGISRAYQWCGLRKRCVARDKVIGDTSWQELQGQGHKFWKSLP